MILSGFASTEMTAKGIQKDKMIRIKPEVESKHDRDFQFYPDEKLERQLERLSRENRRLRKRIRRLERAMAQMQDWMLDMEDSNDYARACPVNLEGRWGDGYLTMTSATDFVFNWNNGRPQAYGYVNERCKGRFVFPDDRSYSIEADHCIIYKEGRHSGHIWKKKHCRRINHRRHG